MAEKDTIEIQVILSPIQSGMAETPTSNQPKNENQKDEEQKRAENNAKDENNAAKALARQIAGKVANTALNNLGNITGEYVAQQNLQTAISEAAAIGGAIALGPAGMVMYGVNKAIEAYNYWSGLKISARDANFAQKRVFGSVKKS